MFYILNPSVTWKTEINCSVFYKGARSDNNVHVQRTHFLVKKIWIKNEIPYNNIRQPNSICLFCLAFLHSLSISIYIGSNSSFTPLKITYRFKISKELPDNCFEYCWLPRDHYCLFCTFSHSLMIVGLKDPHCLKWGFWICGQNSTLILFTMLYD